MTTILAVIITSLLLGWTFVEYSQIPDCALEEITCEMGEIKFDTSRTPQYIN